MTKSQWKCVDFFFVNLLTSWLNMICESLLFWTWFPHADNRIVSSAGKFNEIFSISPPTEYLIPYWDRTSNNNLVWQLRSSVMEYEQTHIFHHDSNSCNFFFKFPIAIINIRTSNGLFILSSFQILAFGHLPSGRETNEPIRKAPKPNNESNKQNLIF